MTDPTFWTPALDRPQIWRTLLGGLLTILVWVGLGFGIILGGTLLSGLPIETVLDTTRWTGMAMFFLTFLGLHLGLMIALPLLHRRRYMSLFGPTGRVNLTHFLRGTGAMLALAVALSLFIFIEELVLPEGITPETTQLRTLGEWLPGLIPALLLILMQVSAEELAFRGYLLQQLRARFRSPLIWALVPALVFGILHFDPTTYGLTNAALYVVNATTMGVLAVFVTLRTGNLSAAIGLHFGNNASLVLVGLAGQLSGFSLLGIDMDPTSGYATYSLALQTLAALLLFALWWRWMDRHRPIANRPSPA